MFITLTVIESIITHLCSVGPLKIWTCCGVTTMCLCCSTLYYFLLF